MTAKKNYVILDVEMRKMDNFKIGDLVTHSQGELTGLRIGIILYSAPCPTRVSSCGSNSVVPKPWWHVYWFNLKKGTRSSPFYLDKVNLENLK